MACDAEPWRLAAADLQAIDPTAFVHGSRATGLAHAGSDVDMATSQSLDALLLKVRRAPAEFHVLEHVQRARVPRLVLRHAATGTEVDIIDRSTDPFSLERDAVVRNLVSADPRVRELGMRIGDWARQHKQAMPPKQGYPNSYTLRLTGFHFLMVRPKGPLLPPLAGQGPELSAQLPLRAEGGVAATAEELFVGWLRHIAAAARQGLCADLRAPRRRAGRGWCVVDPATGRNLTDFRFSQAAVIASLARQSLRELQEVERSSSSDSGSGSRSRSPRRL
mmetsp:Transcript_65805/g.195840  ORF Transcript_65805/g.195840 Transcript_65805/m.195840 type:complete len:278 (-) Transcript_65805:101-934(-)